MNYVFQIDASNYKILAKEIGGNCQIVFNCIKRNCAKRTANYSK